MGLAALPPAPTSYKIQDIVPSCLGHRLPKDCFPESKAVPMGLYKRVVCGFTEQI